MYLDRFARQLESKFESGLFTVKKAEKIDPRAKEYLHRLEEAGRVERVCWGWYRFPREFEDVWDFLVKENGFKVVIKQTAASFWNYDFVHRNVYRLAVQNSSYKRALEEFAKKKGWIFEVEDYDDLRKRFDYQEVDGLYIEKPESCIVDCMTVWSFLDAFAVLFFRREEVSLKKLKGLGRWRRISRTKIRAWNATKYGCNLFNDRMDEEMFDVRKTSLKREDVKELVEEAVEKVVEFA